MPESLPTLYNTYQMTSRASRVGFDWEDLEEIRDKFLEEFEELQQARREGNEERIKEEVGDLVFVALNIARYLRIDPETALRKANSKFSKRFRAMERVLGGQGRSLKDVTVEEMEEIWELQKGE
jgi:tetrapyrrole methylase family protein/MazG family protein